MMSLTSLTICLTQNCTRIWKINHPPPKKIHKTNQKQDYWPIFDIIYNMWSDFIKEEVVSMSTMMNGLKHITSSKSPTEFNDLEFS